MAEHNDLGQAGEALAVAELRRLGYDILHTNWRFGKDEVDIIAKEKRHDCVCRGKDPAD